MNVRPFSKLTYPGHATTGSLILIGLLASLCAALLDQAYVVAFAIAPIIVLNIGFREAGLRFSTDRIGSILFHAGCALLYTAVLAVRFWQLR